MGLLLLFGSHLWAKLCQVSVKGVVLEAGHVDRNAVVVLRISSHWELLRVSSAVRRCQSL